MHLMPPSADSTGPHASLLLPLATVLLATGIAVFKWRFPCTSVNDLQREGTSVQGLLTKALQEDLLGEMEGQFRQEWRRYRDDIEGIRLRAIQEPDSRSHPIAWTRFQWHQLRAIDGCYTVLRTLAASIKWKTEMEKKNRQYFIPVQAYSSGVDTPNITDFFQIPESTE
ncbi:hypothetical protein Moror_3646 [Moniliophthora roreri MCA 2997]|uniref:Uncharacterized protein n=2 Tax=Moniliophthora roreri TaxID=221103 RepID=V2WX06_MONRO|nr:hypothetical protein Moror_3646 [Moniliophthora roreri MCA 2997]